MAESPFALSFGLSVLRLLGPNLYSNIAAVLSEMVANAWDADADLVNLHMNPMRDEIRITDDGQGMSKKEINEKYLNIGFLKRAGEVSPFTPKGRHVMGRKGIGKLAVFSFAREVSVISNDGTGAVGCKLDWDDIEAAIDKNNWYTPTELDLGGMDIPKGTQVILRKLRGEKIKDINLVRRKIARRFLVLDKENDFQVKIGDTPISSADCPFYKKMEYVWYLGDESKHHLKLFPHLLRDAIKIENNQIEVHGKTYQVRGWIGTVEKPADLLENKQKRGDQREDGNNTIALFAYGKMIQEDILQGYKIAETFTEYMVGNIEVDFLDSDDQPDIVTSDRQRVVQDDPRYEVVRDFIYGCVRKAAKNWDLWRLEKKTTAARQNAVVKQWYDGLNKTKQEQANRILGKVDKLENITEKQRSELYQDAVENFQKVKDVSASALRSMNDVAFVDLLKTNDSKPSKPAPVSSNAGAQNPSSDEPPKATRAPQTSVGANFGEIRKILGTISIQDDLKSVALYDLTQAETAFRCQAYKACVVMLGAVLEGVMLGLIRRADVFDKVIADAPQISKKLQKLGWFSNPNMKRDDLLEKVSEELGFEDYKMIIYHLIPSVKHSKIGDIQEFRNTIHPWLAIKRPDIYKDIDHNRVSHLQTALITLLKQITQWNPEQPKT
jgi:hypothetical protein